ncbi:AP-1 complex subunit sigma-3 [Lates japonicus]|uniref:AP-1 complex subunit sigma-3 n=1 Tax=Lates japonicus TaxID=270547 RepID=A0AAD3R2B6_LATJO|nr:AP-1 complex subunit sigma-3 [Lates japonicus]
MVSLWKPLAELSSLLCFYSGLRPRVAPVRENSTDQTAQRREGRVHLYASLYFCAGLEEQDNELLALEVLHRYVELLDKYFGNVCELDIIFNFEKAYFILDEFLMGGEILETSKVAVGVVMEEADTLQETMEEYMSKPAY